MWSIWTTLTAVILALAAAVLIMFRVDPFQATVSEKILFFFSFFMGTWGLVALLIFSVRRLWSKHLSATQIFNLSLWQGFLVSVALIVFLILRKSF